MENSDQDLYEILHLHPSAPLKVVQAAYRRLALLYHPDRNPSPEATELMARVNAAYEVLGDPEKRASYDLARETTANNTSTRQPSHQSGYGERSPSSSRAGDETGTESGQANYFSLGSTKDMVTRVQGNPIDVYVYEGLGEETWYYDRDAIVDFDLATGRVRGWSNPARTLQILMSQAPRPQGTRYLEEGLLRDEVVALQGSIPAEVTVSEALDREIWLFRGGSTIEFCYSTGRVTDWEDIDSTLTISHDGPFGDGSFGFTPEAIWTSPRTRWHIVNDVPNSYTGWRDISIAVSDYTEPSYVLFVRVQDRRLEVFVGFMGTPVSSDEETLVRWQFDGGRPHQCLWNAGNSNDGVFVPEDEIPPFLTGLSNGSELLVQTSTVRGQIIAATFQIAGFQEAAKPVLDMWRRAGIPSHRHGSAGGGCFLLPATVMALATLSITVGTIVF